MISTNLPIALWTHKATNDPKLREISWSELREWLLNHEERKAKGGMLWSPTSYVPDTTRGKENVAELSALVLDFDDGIRPEEITPGWEKWEYVIHSSFGHDPAKPHWRAVFPLRELVPNSEWPDLHARLAHWIGLGHSDKSCKDSGRIYFLPTCPPGAERFAEHHPGEWLDPYQAPQLPEPHKEERERVKSTNTAIAKGAGKYGTLDVVEWFRHHNCYGAYVVGNKHSVMCPWESEHSDNGTKRRPAEDGDTVVWEADGKNGWPQFKCLHAHCVDRKIEDVIAYWGDADIFCMENFQPKQWRLAGKIAAQLEDETGEAGKSPSELNLARIWARSNESRFAFFSGAQWWAYKEGRWQYSSSEVVETEVQRWMESLKSDGVELSITATKVANVVKLSRAHLGVHEPDELNACPTLVPVINGVYDTETDRLLPHSPDYFLTTQFPVHYEPNQECPRWKQFLHETLLTRDGKPCVEWVAAMQEWFGYCLVADNSAQAAMLWVGEGRNGKGVAARALEALIGKDQYCAIPIEQLHDPYHRAELQGKLVGFVNEIDRKAMLRNGTHFKSITGGDTISARRPTEKVFSFVPFCRITISTNTLPASDDPTNGFFRRLLLMEWRRSFTAEEMDPVLDTKLKAELPGILNWALEGLKRFRDRGNKFPELPESDLLRDAYRLSQNPLAQFILNECEMEKNACVFFSDFYAAYKKWALDGGYSLYQIGTHTAVGLALEKRGFKVHIGRAVNNEGKKRRGAMRLGIGLRSEDDEEQESLFP